MTDEYNLKEPEIYLLASDREELIADMRLLRAIADVHRKQKINTAFFEHSFRYPAARRYCLDNKDAPIEVQEVGMYDATDSALFIITHSKENPEKKRAVFLGKTEKLEKLTEILSASGFSVRQTVL